LGGRLGDGRIRNQRFETRSFMPDDCSLSTHHAHSIGEVTESSQKLSEDAECLQNEAVPFSRDVRNRISELASIRRLLRRIVISLILIWFILSLMLSLYNKWMFAPGEFDFPFPLFITAMHMVTQFCLSGVVLYWIPKMRPRGGEFLSIKEYMYFCLYICIDDSLKIGPCGMASGTDIGLSNASLKYITLAFYSRSDLDAINGSAM